MNGLRPPHSATIIFYYIQNMEEYIGERGECFIDMKMILIIKCS